MNTRMKGLLTVAIATGGILSALLLGSNSAWAASPFGWRSPGHYGYSASQPRYVANAGTFGRFFKNGNNGYRPGWGVARNNWGANNWGHSNNWGRNNNWGRSNNVRPRRPFW